MYALMLMRPEVVKILHMKRKWDAMEVWHLLFIVSSCNLLANSMLCSLKWSDEKTWHNISGPTCFKTTYRNQFQNDEKLLTNAKTFAPAAWYKPQMQNKLCYLIIRWNMISSQFKSISVLKNCSVTIQSYKK